MRIATYILIFWWMCLSINVCMPLSFADNGVEKMSNNLILFSEHHVAFSTGHDIKLMDVNSKKEADVSIKTYSYGDFYIVWPSKIAWISENKLYTYDPLTKIINERKLPIKQLPPTFLISISPSGNRIAYLNSYGKCLYIGDAPKIGQRDTAIGSKSELHIFDLGKNEDHIITSNAFDWGPPQWSPDERKILYTRPSSDSYFNQEYLNKVNVNNNYFWQNLIQSAIFVYDFDRKLDYKLCDGIEPQWSPNGNKIAFLTKNNKIGIYDLGSNKKTELLTKGKVDVVTLKISWSLNGEYIAYLGKPKHTFVSYLKALSRLYERPLGLWIAKTDNTQERYVQTRNFGDIKYVPENYEALFKK